MATVKLEKLVRPPANQPSAGIVIGFRITSSIDGGSRYFEVTLDTSNNGLPDLAAVLSAYQTLAPIMQSWLFTATHPVVLTTATMTSPLIGLVFSTFSDLTPS